MGLQFACCSSLESLVHAKAAFTSNLIRGPWTSRHDMALTGTAPSTRLRLLESSGARAIISLQCLGACLAVAQMPVLRTSCLRFLRSVAASPCAPPGSGCSSHSQPNLHLRSAEDRPAADSAPSHDASAASIVNLSLEALECFMAERQMASLQSNAKHKPHRARPNYDNRQRLMNSFQRHKPKHV